MAIEQLHEQWDNGNTNESRELELKRVFRCSSQEEYIKYIQTAPLKDHVLQIDGMLPFWVNGVDISRLLSQPDGKFMFEAVFKLTTMNPSDVQYASLPPWCYPVQDLQFSGEAKEISVTTYYPHGEDIPFPLINTAGVPLEASGVKGMTKMSFTWNSLYYNPSLTWITQSKINKTSCMICDILFEPRTLLCNNYQGSEIIEYTPEGNVKWVYYKKSIDLTINPDTWNEKYLNVGTHAINSRTNFLEELWRVVTEDSIAYMYHSDYIEYNRENGGYGNGEPLSTPMFLDITGNTISPFVKVDLPNGGSTYKQEEVYMYGTPFEPIDFNCIYLPATRGWRL